MMTDPPGPDAAPSGPKSVRDLLPTLVHQIPVGVGVVRRDRSFAFANEALSRILGLPPGNDRPRMRMAPLRQEDGRPYERDEEPLARALEDGRGAVREAVEIMRPDGAAEHAFLTTVPVSDGDGKRVSVIVYLEGRPVEQDEPSLREAYVATLSHELRTPITAIYGGAQLLLHDDLALDVRTTVLTDVAAEAEHLHLLVEDLLALARVERHVQAAGRDPVLLQHIAVQAAAAEERRWPGRRVAVRVVTDTPAACADEGLVLQVLRNLIANAIKSSPAGTDVDVDVSASDSDVCVTIGDRGAGVPPGLGDDTFRLYHRSPEAAARMPGTGIEMFVARALVVAQGGRIWQVDRLGGGAEIGLSLPIYANTDLD